MSFKRRPDADLPKPLQARRMGVSPGALIAIMALVGIAVTVYLSTRESYRHVSTFEYVGPAECAGCHEEQAKSWAETRMAKSFEVLLPGRKTMEKKLVGMDPDHDYSQDEDCLPCHTTGFGKVGGFVSIEETPHMAGVTCEACHGPGGSYAYSVMDADDPTFQTSEARKAGLIYPPTAQVCVECHNENSPFVNTEFEFDYKSALEKGTHRHFQLKYDHEG